MKKLRPKKEVRFVKDAQQSSEVSEFINQCIAKVNQKATTNVHTIKKWRILD